MSATKYAAARRIAVGGMAEVLLASQQGIGGFERLVVIKRILPRLREDQEFVQMFLDEARLAATLKHQNIVETLDVFKEEGTYNVALEYISGEDLRHIIGRARRREVEIPVTVACRLVADIASALDYIHNATGLEGKPLDVVHRDIGPSNIVVGYNGVPKLIDFGVAKAQISSIYTRPGTLKGKFAYMSPEQIEHKDLDGRSDLFSLCIVLYEMLTARRLFKGASQSAVLQAVMQQKIRRPSDLNSEVPPALDDIVLGGLRRRRRDRIQSAAELRRQLEEFLGSQLPITGTRQVGDWMESAMADRKKQRLVTEREVVQIARGSASNVDPEALSALPSMFGSTSGSLGSGAGSVTATPATPAGFSVAPSSVAGGTNITGSTPNARKPGTWIVLGAGLVLLLGLLLGGAFWMGSRGTPQEAPASKVAKTQAISTTPTTAPTALMFHVVPTGAAIAIDDEIKVQSVGPAGALVPVSPAAKVAVRVQAKGYKPHVVTLDAPASGTSHLYINLAWSGASAGMARETSSQATLQASPKRSIRSSKRSRRSSRARKRSVASKPVRFSYSPSDAVLAIDGIVRPGSSPVLVAGLAPGVHMVRLSKDGYDPATQQFQLAPTQSRVNLQMRLKRAVQQLAVRIVSSPSGAALRIDGRYQGNTPLEGLRLPKGKRHSVQLDLPGHRRWSGTFTPRDGHTRLSASLQRAAVAQPKPATKPAPAAAPPAPAPKRKEPTIAAKGKVRVLSPNVYGEVWINGKRYGHPPLIANNITAGVATVEIRVGDTVRRRKRVRVKQGAETRARFR